MTVRELITELGRVKNPARQVHILPPETARYSEEIVAVDILGDASPVVLFVTDRNGKYRAQ